MKVLYIEWSFFGIGKIQVKVENWELTIEVEWFPRYIPKFVFSAELEGSIMVLTSAGNFIETELNHFIQRNPEPVACLNFLDNS